MNQTTDLSDDGIICGGDFVKYSVKHLKGLGQLERYFLLLGHIIVTKRATKAAGIQDSDGLELKNSDTSSTDH